MYKYNDNIKHLKIYLNCQKTNILSHYFIIFKQLFYIINRKDKLSV